MLKRIVLVNQDSGYMTIDIANAFADKYDEVVLMAGLIVPMNIELNPKVKICNITRYNRKNSFTRTFSWIVGALQVLFCLKTRYRKHELFFSTNPPTLVFNLLFLKRKFSILIWDLYPDGLVVSGFLKPKNPVIILWSRVNKRIFPKAGAIFTLTKGMAKSLNKYVSSDLVRIVPAWSSGFILPEYKNSINPFVKKYKLEGKFIILYSGNLGKEHEVESLIYLSEKLTTIENIIIIIAGSGWKFETLKSEIAKRQLANCKLLPKQSAKLFQAALVATNLGVVSLKDEVAPMSIPSKTYNILASGKPILCIGGENSDLSELLHKTETGAAFSPSKLNEMANFVLSLLNNPEVYSKYCKNAIKTTNNYTLDNAHKIVGIHQEVSKEIQN